MALQIFSCVGPALGHMPLQIPEVVKCFPAHSYLFEIFHNEYAIFYISTAGMYLHNDIIWELFFTHAGSYLIGIGDHRNFML